MKVGDLVKKRWGRIDPDIKDKPGVILDYTQTGNRIYVTVAWPTRVICCLDSELQNFDEDNWYESL